MMFQSAGFDRCISLQNIHSNGWDFTRLMHSTMERKPNEPFSVLLITSSSRGEGGKGDGRMKCDLH